MSVSPLKTPISDLRLRRVRSRRNWSWSEPFSDDAVKQVIQKMRLLSFPNSGSVTPRYESELESDASNPSLPSAPPPDYSASLSDELLVNIFNRISCTKQLLSYSLVCKRWCCVCGKLIKSIRLLDWEFLESGRLTFRFPNLVDVDIVPASIRFERNSGILLSTKSLNVYLNSRVLGNDGLFLRKGDILASESIDGGLRLLSAECKNLQKIALMNAGPEGLSCLGEECELLQVMELHNCGDFALMGICKFRNLQILKLTGRVSGVYDSAVSDIGLTILAQGCIRLMKLELVGCEGSYDGIKAIGMCCQMLEELTVCDHRMGDGWLSALSYCSNLKILRIHSCTYIDENPGQDKHIGSCLMLEELHLARCRMQDKNGIRALFLVCKNVRGLFIEDCWGLEDGIFAAAVVCRKIRSVSLDGCSSLTTQGLKSVFLSWKELERLKVISCNNVKDSEITTELAKLFSGLKELKWRPGSRSLLSSSLMGTGIGQKGGRYFKRN